MPSALDRAVDWLRAGGIVAYPTDTFYGLAVDPRQEAAVQALFDLKGRDPAMAVPLIAASRAQAEACLGRFDRATARLADAFWPGPLSVVVDAPVLVSGLVHGGRRSVAVRVPASAPACALAERFGFPVTATSANRTGAPPVRRAADLDAVGRDARVFVLDAGETAGGAPSTIVDARMTPAQLVRTGAIAWDRVLTFLEG
ncbi:MAG: threonylcarbamoyl-AMP synthase [Acidobacteria bacterium]|nr:threonylcarbamoyl-AMP synthase [Acidobacteriota bacterium]